MESTRSMESAAGGASKIKVENQVQNTFFQLTNGTKGKASKSVLASSILVDELLDLSSGGSGHWDLLAVYSHVRASGEDA